MNNSKHPYVEFENTQLWHVIEKAISDLEANQDLRLTTLREYIVGYICKQLNDERLLRDTFQTDPIPSA